MSRLPVFLCLLLCSAAIQAGPKVVFDSGRTISSDKYLSELQSKPVAKQKPNISKLATSSTPEMTVGRVEKRSVSLPYLPSPLFLVGADNISIQWLKKHRQSRCGGLDCQFSVCLRPSSCNSRYRWPPSVSSLW